MNKYFTKEYIKECDCKEIQELRPEILDIGDWCFSPHTNKIFLFDEAFAHFFDRKGTRTIIWLPTGDQVEEEIVKIIDKNKNLDYKFTRQGMVKKYYAEITDYSIHSGKDGYYIVHSENSLNPYIAKIKLLKKLLKVKK